MDELVQWLGDQLDEDERTARAVTTPGTWRVGHSHGGPTVEGEGWTVGNADDLDAAHIARHDPARVLREIDTKRRLLELHALEYRDRPERVLGEADDPFCAECSGEAFPCETLRLLALPYADRPGYREEWRPVLS